MKFLSASLIFSWISTSTASTAAVGGVLPSSSVVSVCPRAGSTTEGYDKYHATSMCDRATYNHFKRSLGRDKIYKSFKALGGCNSVPNEKTVKCPAAGARVNMNHNELVPVTSGFDTIFIVENQASTPVVISYVNEVGLEVSAMNPDVSPAIADPDSILLPGQWKDVSAFEGHEFVVRQILKTGVAGNVLLQHRPGLIPIGLYSQGTLECPDEDIEPIVNNTLAPQFRRTPPTGPLPCNAMAIGFRNMANCPLHGYHVSGGGETCIENFKFHLGVEDNVPDYHTDWLSKTKFENTYIGHTFHFRLAANPAVLVDTITMSPVIVTDCPTNAAAVSVGTVGETIAAQIGNPTFTNGTTSTYNIPYYSNVTTSSVLTSTKYTI